MAILDVLTFPDPRLRKKSKAIESVTNEVKKLANDMVETMYDFNGIGLAAPQVNSLLRLIALDTRPTKEGRYKNEDMTSLEQSIEQPLILINPEILEKTGETTYEEGCLSLPSYFESVKRFDWIKIEALNLKGEKFQLEVDGLLAICIQHEIDHLDGKLFIDRLSPIKANRIKSKIKKYGYPDREDETEEELSKEL